MEMLREIFLSATLLALPSPGNKEAATLTARMEAKYRSARTLRATFLQRYSENGRLLRSESGTAYFRRPGRMRWEYEAPEKDLFLVDGKTAWFYVPADHTVTRAPAKQSSDLRTPMALLAGEMKVSRICSHVELASSEKPEAPGDAVLHCTLRGAKNPDSTDHAQDAQDAAFFEVAPDSGELVRILIRQSDAVEVEFRFRNWGFDPPLPPSMFHFDVPPGVAIVKGEAALADPGAR